MTQESPAAPNGRGPIGKATPEQLAESERFGRDFEYYNAHREELLAQYPEMWVAIYKQQVVGVASDPRELLVAVRNQGVPRGRGLFQFLTRTPEVLILHS